MALAASLASSQHAAAFNPPFTGHDLVVTHAAVPSGEEATTHFLTYSHTRFASNQVVWRYNPLLAPATLSAATVVDVVQGAMNRWSAVCNVHFTYGGSTEAAVGSSDGLHVVGWSPGLFTGGPGGMTYLTLGQTITDADIGFNATWVLDPGSLDPMAVHEVGHLLGLQHSDEQASVMAGPPLTDYNELPYVSTLRADDVTACQALYGPALGAMPTNPPPRPVCTLTAGTTSMSSGLPVALDASCTGYPYSYTWTNCSSGDPLSSSCQAGAAQAGPQTYSVVATNAGGNSTPATVNVNWTGAVPSCVLSADLTGMMLPAGTSIVFTATCSNGPTAFDWQNCTPSGFDQCTASSSVTGAETYSVRAGNANGWGAPTSTTVTWQDATATPLACQLTPQDVTARVGTNVLLQATCTDVATTYTWTGCNSAGPTCTTTSSSNGQVRYTVSAADANGTSVSASTTVTWVSPHYLGPPKCSLVPGSATPVVGTTLVLSAACSNGPSSYTWSNCISASEACTATASKAGPQTYTVSGVNADGTGTPATVTIKWVSREQLPATTPVCTLSANRAAPIAGEALQLHATCTNNPTAYQWSGCAGAGAGAAANCTAVEHSAGIRSYAVSASNTAGSGPRAIVSVNWQAKGQYNRVPVSEVEAVEFYHAGLDHFFITANAEEIRALDDGVFRGWERTGLGFKVLPAGASDAASSPVCRFYGNPAAGLDSHFYSASPAECEAVQERFGAEWLLESSEVFRAYLPDGTTGACAPGLAPLYRSFNGRSDPNHRYTTDAPTQALMVSDGYLAEGYGPQPTIMCVLR